MSIIVIPDWLDNGYFLFYIFAENSEFATLDIYFFHGKIKWSSKHLLVLFFVWFDYT